MLMGWEYVGEVMLVYPSSQITVVISHVRHAGQLGISSYA